MDDLRELLQKGIVSVTFTKKDGSERVMLCTLFPDFLPATDGNGSYNGITVVYDLENEGWRSFRDDSVTDYEVVKTIKESDENIS